jgi:hypothetical protein
VAKPAVAASSSDGALQVGDRIECRHGGGPKFFPGSVQAASADGATFDVLYDDGDVEAKVPRYRIKRDGEKEPRDLRAGAPVDVRHGGGKTLFPATIGAIADAAANTYDVVYDDGDKETKVPRKFIMAQCLSPAESKATAVAADAAAAMAKAEAEATANAKAEAKEAAKKAVAALDPKLVDQLRAAFKHFDADANGAWSRGEMNKYQAALGEPTMQQADFERAFEYFGIALDASGHVPLEGVLRMYGETGELAKDMGILQKAGVLCGQQEKGAGGQQQDLQHSQQRKPEGRKSSLKPLKPLPSYPPLPLKP